MSEPFQWNKNRLLILEDFKGPVDQNNNYIAASRIDLGYLFNCTENIKSSIYEFTVTGIPVFTLFHPLFSWVRIEEINIVNLKPLLKHEQGHFDLGEEYRRKIGKEMDAKFKGKSFSCKSKNRENALQEVKIILDEKFIPLMDEYNQAQRKYEDDTSHGSLIDEQEKYDIRFLKLYL